MKKLKNLLRFFNFFTASERHITYYSPRTSYPFGYPEVVTEKYLDTASGQEMLKKRVVNTHNHQGLLVQQQIFDSTDTYLYTLSWDYNSMGKLIREVDALQRVREWRYDLNGNCIFEKGHNPNAYKEYSYDLADRLIRQDEIHTDGVVRTTSYRYNLLSQVVGVTDCYGNETLYDYDAFGRVMQISYPIVLDEEGILKSPKLTHSYDLMGNVTKSIDCRGNAKIMSYTLRGQVAAAIYPDGSTERNTYSREGLLQSSCAKNGTITSYSYDILGRVIKTEMMSHSGEVLSTQSTAYNGFHKIYDVDAMGNVTYYEYYSDGNLKSTQCGDLLKTFSYDTLGRLHSSTEHYGPNSEDVIIKTQEYDLLNRLIEERVEDGYGTIFTKVNYTYDSSGNICETRYGNGSSTSITYDSHGEAIIATDAEGHQSFTKCYYDFKNLIGQNVKYKEMIDALGNVTMIICDALSRPVIHIRKDCMGMITQRYEIAYDLNGNKCSVTDIIFSGSNVRMVTNKIIYNALNQPIACHEAVGTPEEKITQIHYNGYGQKIICQKADGTSLNHKYDALGRLTFLYSSDQTVHYAYTYDLNNLPIKVIDVVHGTSTQKRYDSKGRLIEEILGNGVELRYSYDALGRTTCLSLPDGSSCAFEYQGPALKKVQRLSSENQLIYEHAYTNFDQNGRLVNSKLIGLAGNITYNYDKIGRLISAKANEWEEYLTYDPVGNLTGQTLSDATGQVTSNYSYNSLYQLQTERGLVGHDYQYDSLYNRTQKDSKPHLHNALNQLLIDGEAIYKYDVNGNLLKKISGDKEIDFTYDALDRLTGISDGITKACYQYDETNRRISKELFYKNISEEWVSEKVLYLYQGQNEIGSLDSKMNMIELRLLGSGKGSEIGAAVAIEIGTRIFAPIHDHAGNIACLIDAHTGLCDETYRYSAFGEELFDNAISPWRFSSKRVDSESGFVYFGRRYYDPKCGRWISQDPIGREGGPNLYAYVLNNPMTNNDAYGLSSFQGQFTNCSDRGLSNLLQTINQGINFICDTWQRECPIPIIRDSLAAVRHLCTHGTLNGFKMEHQWAQSSNGQVYGLDLFEDTRIMYTNGIKNTLESAVEGAENISQHFGGSRVYYTHSNTHGVICDIFETICHRLDLYTNAVTKQVENTRERLAEVGPTGKILQYAFSQGGQVVNSQKYYLSYEERMQLSVRTLGSAKIVSSKDFGNVVNYVNIMDPVPWISDFPGMIRSFFDDNYKVVFITSSYKYFFDHQLKNDSYQSALKNEGGDYVDKFKKSR